MMKKILCVFIAIVLSFSITAFAENAQPSLELSTQWVNLDNQSVLKIDVAINMGIDFSDEMLLFKILRPDIDEADTNKTTFEKYARITQHYLDSEGKVSFSFNFKDVEGKYKVVAQSQRSDYKVETEFVIPSVEKLNELLNKLKNNEFTSETLADFIEVNKNALGMSAMTFNSLNNETLPSICQYVIDNITDYSVVGIMDMINEATAVKGITSYETPENIGKILDISNIKNVLLSDVRYSDFETLGTEEKNILFSGMKQYTFDTVSDVCKGFMTELAVTNIRSIETYSEISGIFEKYNTELSPSVYIAYSDLDLTKRANVNMAIAVRLGEIVTASDFERICNEEIIKVNLTPPPAGSGGGGGGGGGRSYSDKNPGLADVSTEAPEIPVPVVKKEAKDVFSDVSESFWGYEAINSLYQKGIIKGKTETEFFPEAEITRAEFLKLVTEGFGIKGECELSFNDVATDKWYYPYVSAAFSNKLVNGVSESFFGADNNITRQDAAVIIYRVLSSREKTGELNGEEFTDKDKISGYAVEAINYLSAKKLLNGFNGEIKPLDTLTRAEGAQMLFNILK